MGISKGLLLGSAAAMLMASGSAFAADLPSRKAAPVEYVKICDVYGRGFYYIPGTNTCLRVGGRIRFELGWHKAANNWTGNSPVATYVTTPPVNQNVTSGNRLDTLGWRSRAYVNMDARTQTAWGTVQTVFSIALRSRSGIFNGSPQLGPGGTDSASPQVYAAYIRFAGFTFGRAPDTFSNGPGYIFYWTNHAGGGAIGKLQLAYTAVFGGGFSATIALEDKDDYATQRASFVAGGLGNRAAPNRLPNAVLTLRVDQGWGFVRASAAIGRTYNVAQAVAAPFTATTYSKTGWAIGADARINLPQLARGDAIFLRAAYADGLVEYVTGGNLTNGSVAKDGRIGSGWQPGIANVSAACNVVTRVCAIGNWKALSFMAAFTHFWTPTLRSNFAVSYLKVTPASVAIAGTNFPKSTAWQGSAQLVWSPTSGFDIGLELYYAKISHKTPVGSAMPAALVAAGVKQNPSDLAVKLRVQRTF